MESRKDSCAYTSMHMHASRAHTAFEDGPTPAEIAAIMEASSEHLTSGPCRHLTNWH